MKFQIVSNARNLISAAENSANKLIKFNLRLSNLTRSNLYWDALRLFVDIHSLEKLRPDHYTVSSTLKACGSVYDVGFGEQVHAFVVKTGWMESYVHVGNTLLSVYAKVGDLGAMRRVVGEIGRPDEYTGTIFLAGLMRMGELGEARKVFAEMPDRSVAVWNAMVTGCVEEGDVEGAVGYFMEMRRLGFWCDGYGFASVLSLYVGCGDLKFGKQLHSLALRSGVLSWISVVNALLSMYFSYGDVEGGWDVFKEAEEVGRDCITYNAMMAGLVCKDMYEEALGMLMDMQTNGLSPNEWTFMTLMSGCGCKKVGCQVHAPVVKRGLDAHTSVANAMISMYSSVGELCTAEVVFEGLKERDLISWNSMISTYAEGGFGRLVFLTFWNMQTAGVASDKFTMGSLLMSTELLYTVAMVHSLVIKNGLSLKLEVSNALISSYASNGINQAHQVFHEMLYRNLISWNTLIGGFLFNGNPVGGLTLFSELLKSDLSPNVCTLTTVMNICSSISALEYGKQVHNFIIRFQFMPETSLENALVHLYAKCGHLDWSLRVFNAIMLKDLVSWNSMISSFAQHGKGKDAILCFKTMQESSSMCPDTATFTTLLSACSHSGLVEDALQILNAMVSNYGIRPGTDHLSCIVDLLGRAGYLDEAEKIGQAETHPNIMWTFFSACIAHGSFSLGRMVAEYLLQTKNHDPSVYVQLSKIYAGAGQWNEAASVREFMRKNGVAKLQGWSSVSF